MDQKAYETTIKRLGLSQVGASRVLGVNERTGRRWVLGERAVPEPVRRLLWLCEQFPDVLEALREMELGNGARRRGPNSPALLPPMNRRRYD